MEGSGAVVLWTLKLVLLLTFITPVRPSTLNRPVPRLCTCASEEDGMVVQPTKGFWDSDDHSDFVKAHAEVRRLWIREG